MQLKQWLKQQQKTPREITRWFRPPVTTAITYKWLNGSAIPRPKHLQTIARKTGYEVTSDDFYGMTRKREQARMRKLVNGGQGEDTSC